MDYQDEMLLKSTAFEEMVATKGWEYVKEYLEKEIQSFSNRAIIDGFKSMEEYNFYRGQVAGLRGILVEVQSSLEHLKLYREKTKSTPTE